MIEAKIVADSVSPEAIRLTTYQLRYPKFIHGEFMTHRVFSRNASSSRAIPTKKLLQEAWDPKLRATPVFWGRNQKGMQAAEELKGWRLWAAKKAWGFAARLAVVMSWTMNKLDIHKQLANRILEPFTHINVVASATEYYNFFGLRLDKGAQPEIRDLAMKMWALYQSSEPKQLKPGEWHLPFVAGRNEEIVLDYINDSETEVDYNQTATKVSVARCARTSYLSFETGKISTIEEDLKLYSRLLGAQPLHASPAEHQGTPDVKVKGKWKNPELHGNFTGWIQYRKTLKGEEMAPIPDEFMTKI